MAETVHRRALFFELYASTRIFERQVGQAKTIFGKMRQDFQGIFSGIESDEQKSLNKRIAQAKAAEDVITQNLEKAAKQRAATEAAMAAGTYGGTAKAADLTAMNAAYNDLQVKLKAIEDLKAKGILSTEEQASLERNQLQVENQIEALRQRMTALAATGVMNEKDQLAVITAQREQYEKLLVLQTEAEQKTAGLTAELEAAGGAGGRMSSLVSLMGSAIPVVGGLTLAFGGAFLMLDHLTMSAAKYGMQILQMASVTGLNTNTLQTQDTTVKNTTFDLQVYTDLMGYYGISAEKVQTIFVRLNKTLADNPQALRNIGITGTDVSSVLTQLSAKITGTTNDTEKMALAEVALGGNLRGTIEPFTAIMNMGIPAIKAYATNMQNLGLIMSDAQVKASAVTDAIHGQMMLAFQGLERQVGEALFPTMNALFLMITSGAKTTKDGFSSIANVIASVIGQIVGFFYGLFGGTQQGLTDLFNQAKAQIKGAADAAATQDALQKRQNQTLADQKQRIEDLQNADQALNDQKTANSQKNQDAQRALTDDINNQTTAIDAQIKTIQDNSQAFNDAQNDKVKALEDYKTQLDAQQKVEDDLGQSTLSVLQNELDMMQDIDQQGRHSGESLIAYQRRLLEQNLKDQIQTEQKKRQTVNDQLQQQIDLQRIASQTAIDQNTAQTKAAVDALTKQKQALADYLRDRKDAMDLALQRENDAITAQVQANERQIKDLTKKTTQSFDDTASAAGISADDIEKTMNTMLDAVQKSAAGTGLNIGQTFNQVITDIKNGDWSGAGDKIGHALGSALVAALQSEITSNPVVATLLGAWAFGKLKNLVSDVPTGGGGGGGGGGGSGALLGLGRLVAPTSATGLATSSVALGLLLSGEGGGKQSNLPDVTAVQKELRTMSPAQLIQAWYDRNSQPFKDLVAALSAPNSQDIINEIEGDIANLQGSQKQNVQDAFNYVRAMASEPMSSGGRTQKFAVGGVTDRPTLAWLSERGHKEVVIPFEDKTRSMQLMRETGLDRLTGGHHVDQSLTVNYNGPVADVLVASRVMARTQQEARRRGFMASRGIS